MLILTQAGLAGGVIAGISVALVAVLLLLAFSIYAIFFRKKIDDEELLSQDLEIAALSGKGILLFG